MAGTVTVTYDGDPDRAEVGSVNRIVVDWTSDGSGNADTTTKKITGRLIKGVTNPGATAPTDDYDIAITDPEGLDVLANCPAAGRLGNRDTANTECAYFFVANVDGTPLSMAQNPVVCDPLTIAISNAGASKVGKLILYWSP